MQFRVTGRRRGDEAVSVEVIPPDVGALDKDARVTATIQVTTRSGKIRAPLTVTDIVSNDPLVAATFVPPNQVEIVVRDLSDTEAAFEITGDAT